MGSLSGLAGEGDSWSVRRRSHSGGEHRFRKRKLYIGV